MLSNQQIAQKTDAIIKACQGLGTREKAIIDVVTSSTYKDLARVAKAYTAFTGKSLEKLIKAETSKGFEKGLVQLFNDRYVVCAERINDNLKDERQLAEAIITLTEEDIPIITEAYFNLFAKDIFEDIHKTVSATKDYGLLFRAWMNQMRYARNTIKEDAKLLFEAAKGAGTKEEVFIRILCTSTPDEYKQIVQSFQQQFGKSLAQTIKAEFTGVSEYAFLLAHNFAQGREQGVAFVISRAKLNNKNSLYVICSTSVGIDKKKLSSVFSEYGEIRAYVKKIATGDYERLLLALLTENVAGGLFRRCCG
uniref:Annexin 6 n=1 Tax=Spironucleus barkhanus TaxID=103874 RepID=A0A142C658_SPIBA|nr:annexin 6 [Spironucleus barkhanus]